MSSPEQEHGTIRAYIIGFILSIVFTLIPYYLVVNQSLTGSALLWAIMSFAVVQMIIQITFFLHIGRGPKPNWNLFFFGSTVGIILIVVGGSIVIINNLHYNMQPSDQVKKIINDENIYQVGGQKTGACQKLKTNHKIIVKNDTISPINTKAGLCDSLTFVNEAKTSQEIVFNTVYAGQSKVSLPKNKNETITLTETGFYNFYQSDNTTAFGYFTVSQ